MEQQVDRDRAKMQELAEKHRLDEAARRTQPPGMFRNRLAGKEDPLPQNYQNAGVSAPQRNWKPPAVNYNYQCGYNPNQHHNPNPTHQPQQEVLQVSVETTPIAGEQSAAQRKAFEEAASRKTQVPAAFAKARTAGKENPLPQNYASSAPGGIPANAPGAYANPAQTVPQSSQPSGLQVINVTLGEGIIGGQVIQVKAPDGNVHDVTVPANLKEGDNLQIRVNPAVIQQQQPPPQQQQQQQPPPQQQQQQPPPPQQQQPPPQQQQYQPSTQQPRQVLSTEQHRQAEEARRAQPPGMFAQRNAGKENPLPQMYTSAAPGGVAANRLGGVVPPPQQVNEATSPLVTQTAPNPAPIPPPKMKTAQQEVVETPQEVLLEAPEVVETPQESVEVTETAEILQQTHILKKPALEYRALSGEMAPVPVPPPKLKPQEEPFLAARAAVGNVDGANARWVGSDVMEAPVGQVARTADGTTVEVRADGTVVQISPDGTKVEKFPDGTKTITSAEGIKLEFLLDGTEKQTFEDGTVLITKPDGTQIQFNRDGTILEQTSGDLLQLNPNGVKYELQKDGTRATHRPDGTTVEQLPDGTKVKKRFGVAYDPNFVPVQNDDLGHGDDDGEMDLSGKNAVELRKICTNLGIPVRTWEPEKLKAAINGHFKKLKE